MVAHYKVESRHHPQPLGKPRTRVTYPLRDRHSPGENRPGVKVGQGAGTLTLRHGIPPPRTSKLSFWMKNILLHFVYCVPKLHIHHAATQQHATTHNNKFQNQGGEGVVKNCLDFFLKFIHFAQYRHPLILCRDLNQSIRGFQATPKLPSQWISLTMSSHSPTTRAA